MGHTQNKLSDTLVHSLNKSLEVAFKDFIGDDNPFNLDILIRKKKGNSAAVIAPQELINKIKADTDNSFDYFHTLQENCFLFEISESPESPLQFFMMKNMELFNYSPSNIEPTLISKDYNATKVLISEISICMEEISLHFNFGNNSNSAISFSQIKSTKDEYRRNLLIHIAKLNNQISTKEKIEELETEHLMFCDEITKL